VPDIPTLAPLAQGLREKAKDRLSPEFWRHLNDVIVKKCNANAHFRGNDVYAPGLRRHNAADEIVQVLIALAVVAEEFIQHWPAPVTTTASPAPTPDEPPQEGAAVPTHATAASPAAGGNEPPRAPIEEQRRYGDLNVAEARDNQYLRDWLVRHSGMQQRGVTRRLNNEHGRRKLRNVFDMAFRDADMAGANIQPDDEAAGRFPIGTAVWADFDGEIWKAEVRVATQLEACLYFPADDSEADLPWEQIFATEEEAVASLKTSTQPATAKHARRPAEKLPGELDYVAIGRLTVSQARELDVADDIAKITGYAPGTVRNKLRDLHGASVIHRQFPWFDENVVGSMTASTALRYDLPSFLAVAFSEGRASIKRKLGSVPGQTKLRTLFPQLDDAPGQ
jgi:hypothetical protein